MSLFRVPPQRATVCSLPPGGNKNAYMKHVDACKEVLLGSGNTPVWLEGRPLAEASGSRNIPGRHAFLPASAALSSDAALTDVQKTKPSPQSLECLTSPSSGRSAPPPAPSAASVEREGGSLRRQVSLQESALIHGHGLLFF